MLPKILDIAEKHTVEIDPRTRGKKETLAKCPFCHEDANKGRKYYLSLNTHDQVYRCFYCNVKGGVLDFESRLTGIPYQEVKAKYFGKNKRKAHPAEYLNPSQLEAIGWKTSQMDRKAFKQFKDLVYQSWLKYEHNQLSELFAELVIIAHMEKQGKRQLELLKYLKKRCEESHISSCFSRLTEEYKKEPNTRADWAKEGVKIARVAWKVSHAQMDFELSKIVLQVPFIHFLYMKEKETQEQNRQVVIAK